MQFFELETENLILTGYSPDDKKRLVECLNGPEFIRYMTMPTPYTLKDADEWINKTFENGWKNNTEYAWALRKKNDKNKKLIGNVSIRSNNSIGFWLAEDSRGKGFIIEAMKRIIKELVVKRGLFEELEWDGNCINISSATVAYKLGFKFIEVQKYKNVTNFDLDLSRYLPYSNSRFMSKLYANELDEDGEIKPELLKNNQNTWPPFIKYCSFWGKELEEFYNGERKHFSKLSEKTLPSEKELLEKANITPFQKEVLLEVAKIKYGETLTYSGLAERLKKPKAVRAVASAVAKNPYPVLIPCHRVIKKDSYGEYVYGVEAKKRLLENERK